MRGKRSGRFKKKERGAVLFKKAFAVYTLVLFIVSLCVVGSVYHTMREMRDNNPEDFIRRKLLNLDREEIFDIVPFNPLYETEDEAAENIKNFLLSEKLEIKKNAKKPNSYVLCKNEDGKSMEIAYADLKVLQTKKKLLGLMRYDIYEMGKIYRAAGPGLYSFKFELPRSFTLKVNGKTAVPNKTEPVKGFSDAGKFVDLPGISFYDMASLTAEPEIKIMQDKTEIPFTSLEKKDGVFVSPINESERFESLEKAGCDFDIISFGKDWSLFLTDDLEGKFNGFSAIKSSFIEGSSMYEKARSWAGGVDISFVSKHRLKDPPFTGEKVSNVVKYGSNAVSCVLHLEKHMRLKTGADRTDVINSTVYLVKYSGAWKVVNIRGIAE